MRFQPSILKALPFLLLFAAACPASPPAPATAAKAGPTVEVRTQSVGISGLDMSPDGTFWMVPERERLVIPVKATGEAGPAIPLVGIPEGLDTEAVAWLGGGRLALGLEATGSGGAVINGRRCDVAIMSRRGGDGAFALARCLALPLERWGLVPRPNRGVEAICHAGGYLAAALETVQEWGRQRLAPLGVVNLESGAWRTHGLALTSTAAQKGKISALHCEPSVAGWLRLVAVERHFGVRRLVSYQVPLEIGQQTLAATVVADLNAIKLRGDNPEGLVRVDSRRWAVINDNHYGRRMGPTYLSFLTLAPW